MNESAIQDEDLTLFTRTENIVTCYKPFIFNRMHRNACVLLTLDIGIFTSSVLKTQSKQPLVHYLL